MSEKERRRPRRLARRRDGGVPVVISHPEDPHAAHVLDILGDEAMLLNIAELPHRASLTIDYARGSLAFRNNGHSIELAKARSLWWRRPQSPDLAQVGNDDVFHFAHNEWQEALNGLWQLVDAPWMNPPARDEVASRKALQLRVASEVGLRTPRTIMTSDPDAARAFITEHGLGRTIFKTFSCTHKIWRETRLVREEDLQILDQVRFAPVIFQEYIPAAADLRVTIVGDRIFPAAIYSTEIDFRTSLGDARVEPCELPSDVENALFALMRRLGLVYGAIDLRRTPAGEHVFLEVNTAGEFLFVEERTRQPIGRAVAEWLVKPS